MIRTFALCAVCSVHGNPCRVAMQAVVFFFTLPGHSPTQCVGHPRFHSFLSRPPTRRGVVDTIADTVSFHTTTYPGTPMIYRGCCVLMLCVCFAKPPPWSFTAVWIPLRFSGRAAVATAPTRAVK